MRALLDTSVLIAAVIKQHVAHERAFAVLERVHGQKDEGIISVHSLAEMYAVLTKLPPPYRHTPEQALLSIEENVVKHCKTIGLAAGEYVALLREAVVARIQGGTVYDALLLKAAVKANAEVIYTLNLKHFQAIAPATAIGMLSAP